MSAEALGLSKLETSEPRRLRVLYGISSVGLGHVRRSLAIAQKLRELDHELSIDFVAAEPVLSFLREGGEKVLDVSSKLESLSLFMEKNSRSGRISDMSEIASQSAKGAERNYRLISPYLRNYDLLIQDEFVETLFFFMWKEEQSLPKNLKTVVITDYVRFETESSNPFNKFKIGYANSMLKKAYLNQDLRIFLDFPDALPENEKTRKWATENFHILGPVVLNPPAEERAELLRQFFRQPSLNIIVFNLGGTAVGRSLVEFVIKNAGQLSEGLGSHLVVFLGPRMDKSEFEAKSNRISLVPFAPEANKYFKMADCVITQAGSSSLYEIASTGAPCVVIPIANHFEQKQNAKRFSARFGFEVLEYKGLSLASLQRAIFDQIKKQKYEPQKPTNAAEEAAKLIYSLVLSSNLASENLASSISAK